jgi:DNA-binding winged helix-turn-helix (wHTH) protein/tetratricopeptide (TPR) repeat protein
MPAGTTNPQGYRFGVFEVDLRAREIRKNGRRVKLQDQPFRVLALLLEHAPNMVGREDLRKLLWDEDTFVEFDHGLSNAINRIREALGDSAENSRFIETLPKRGYRFMASVEKTNGASTAPTTPDQNDPKAISSHVAGRRTVAVVPLEFRSASADDKFLSVALADAVANRLGSATSLVIRPMRAVMKYAGKNADWTQIARELNVDLVVEGSIQKQDLRVRVLAQVWELRSAQTLHSAKFDGEMCDLFGLQDRLADFVFDALVPRPREKRVQAVSPVARHPLAFELYMRAVDRTMSFDRFDLTSACEMLERAVDLDPQFADAWGLLATVSYHMGAHVDPDPKWFNQAESASARTLDLDPIHCDAFCVSGMILWSPARGFQFRPALRALNTALKLNPSHVFGRNHRSAVLFHMGFHQRALDDCNEGILANPYFALLQSSRSYIAVYEGNYEKAEELVEKALSIEPGLVHANIHGPLPSIYAGNFEKARDKLRKARQMTPIEPQLMCLEGLILAHEGDFSRAEKLADEAAANQRSMVHTHHCWHAAACVYALCGKPEKAIAELQRCAQGGLPNHRAFEKDPHLRSLHSHPDFAALMGALRRDHEAFRDEFGLGESSV